MTLKQPKPGKERALKELRKAEKEISKLKRELKAGTLDGRKLESGLENLQKGVCDVILQVPHFTPGKTPGK